MTRTNNIAEKELPTFDLKRCKRCGICSHFCPVGAIGVRGTGVPYLAKPEACNSCRLCEDMCPDWAVCLETQTIDEKAPEGAGLEETPACVQS